MIVGAGRLNRTLLFACALAMSALLSSCASNSGPSDRPSVDYGGSHGNPWYQTGGGFHTQRSGRFGPPYGYWRR